MAGKPRRNPVTDDQIVESYRLTRSVFKTAAALGIGATTAHRVLMKLNEPRNGLEHYRANATKYRGVEPQIREAYEKGATYSQLREQFGDAGDADYALKQALKRAGATLRENPAEREKPGEIEKIREMNAKRIGQIPISLALGRSQSFVGRAMRRHGITPLSATMKGDRHPNWKGGRAVDGNGYIRIWIAPDDPMAGMALNDSSILEHRLVMARKLGRPLLRSETVHHIDGNRGNNDPANLQLRHGKHGKHAVMICLDCGSHNVGHAPIAETPPKGT